VHAFSAPLPPRCSAISRVTSIAQVQRTRSPRAGSQGSAREREVPDAAVDAFQPQYIRKRSRCPHLIAEAHRRASSRLAKAKRGGAGGTAYSQRGRIVRCTRHLCKPGQHALNRNSGFASLALTPIGALGGGRRRPVLLLLFALAVCSGCAGGGSHQQGERETP